MVQRVANKKYNISTKISLELPFKMGSEKESPSDPCRIWKFKESSR